MFCRFCGSKLFSDSTFCHSCGKPASAVPILEKTVDTGSPGPIPGPPAKSPAINIAETEKTFLSLTGVTVTNSRIMVPGHTYAMAGITSVNYAVVPPKRGWPIFTAVVGAILLIAQVFAPGTILLIIGVLWAVLLKTQYALALISASGEVRAVVSPDSAYVTRIVEAVNEAIVYRS
jgi:hypothetical protein